MRRLRRLSPIVVLAATLLTTQASGQAGQRRESTNRDRSDFTMLRDEGFPMNLDPEIISASAADIDDDDIVMGVVINGEARAYPVGYMNGPDNEIVNDELGGELIAPSW